MPLKSLIRFIRSKISIQLCLTARSRYLLTSYFLIASVVQLMCPKYEPLKCKKLQYVLAGCPPDGARINRCYWSLVTVPIRQYQQLLASSLPSIACWSSHYSRDTFVRCHHSQAATIYPMESHKTSDSTVLKAVSAVSEWQNANCCLRAVMWWAV